MMDPEIPKNEGFFEQIKLIVPEGLRAQPRSRQAGERGHAPPRRRRRRGDRGRDAARAARARGAADVQDRHPDDHHRRRPAHRRVVHRPLGRGVRGLVQRVEGHGRVGRAQRELRQPLEGDRRDQRVAVPARPVEPRLPHRLRRPRPVARHLRQPLREGSARRRQGLHVRRRHEVPDARHLRRRERRAERDDPPLRQRRPVPRRAHRRLGADAGRRAHHVRLRRRRRLGRPARPRSAGRARRRARRVRVGRRRRAATTASCSPARSKTSRSRSTTPRPQQLRAEPRASRVPERWATASGSTSAARSPTSSA